MNNWIYIVGGIGMLIIPITILFSGDAKKKRTAFETRKRPTRKETHTNPLKTQQAAKSSKDTVHADAYAKVQSLIRKSSPPPKPPAPPNPPAPPLEVDGGAGHFAAFCESPQVGSPRVTEYPYKTIRASGDGCMALGSVTSAGNGSFIQGYVNTNDLHQNSQDSVTDLRQEIIDEYKEMVKKQDVLSRMARIDELKAEYKSIYKAIDSAEHAGLIVAENHLQRNLHQTKSELQNLRSEGMMYDNLADETVKQIIKHGRKKSKRKKRGARDAASTGPR